MGGQSVNRWPQFGHFRRKIHDRNSLTQPSVMRRKVRFRRSWYLNVASLLQTGQDWQYKGSSPDSTLCVWALIFSSMVIMIQVFYGIVGRAVIYPDPAAPRFLSH